MISVFECPQSMDARNSIECFKVANSLTFSGKDSTENTILLRLSGNHGTLGIRFD